MFANEDFSLTPIHLVTIAADCFHTPQRSRKLEPRHILPDTSGLCDETRFAQVAVGWSEEGISIEVDVQKAFEQAFYPDVQTGDSVEIFIDTRDRKTSGWNTRFCHHFFFFAEALEGKIAGEITRFRTEDIHEWCNPNDLQVKSHLGKSSYQLAIFIPNSCLQGYSPDQFDRLGFTYRINRLMGDPQHFSVTSTEFQVDQQPSLWSSLRLVR